MSGQFGIYLHGLMENIAELEEREKRMNDNNDTRTPAELQEWLAQVERNYRWDETSGRLEHNHYGGEYMPHSARSIPRLCQELRRAWARVERLDVVVDAASLVDVYSQEFAMGIRSPGSISALAFLRAKLNALSGDMLEAQPKEGGGQDE